MSCIRKISSNTLRTQLEKRRMFLTNMAKITVQITGQNYCHHYLLLCKASWFPQSIVIFSLKVRKHYLHLHCWLKSEGIYL